MLWEEAVEGDGNDVVQGTSRALANVLDQARAVAPSDAAVLLLGESGVGKELIAKRIHEQSRRSAGPLITVNCASIPRDLFESEFFGHVRGAFTGATRDRIGRLELANGGTLFLDEVGEIPAELQGKLLRALQNLTFERIGDERTRKANVRFIAATNRNLVEDISDGRFRRDLYFRLSVFPIEVPPLRARPDDIPTLAKYFVRLLAANSGRAEPALTDDHMKRLQMYDWPGNVRELKNVIERAFILSGDGPGPLNLDRALPRSAVTHAGRLPVLTSKVPARGFFSAVEFEQLERLNLIGALEAAHWKVSGENSAASLLGLNPSTLSSRLKTLGIRKPDRASLYSRLGGYRGIAGLAHDLFGRVLSDPQLSRFWEHRSTIGLLREEQLLVAFVATASGGPGQYQGRDMKTAHRELGISHADWEIFRVILRRSLDGLGIVDPERNEVIDFTESLRNEIVQH